MPCNEGEGGATSSRLGHKFLSTVGRPHLSACSRFKLGGFCRPSLLAAAAKVGHKELVPPSDWRVHSAYSHTMQCDWEHTPRSECRVSTVTAMRGVGTVRMSTMVATRAHPRRAAARSLPASVSQSPASARSAVRRSWSVPPKLKAPAAYAAMQADRQRPSRHRVCMKPLRSADTVP
jgi:hypothetical protein